MKCRDCYTLAPNRVWRTYLGGRTLDGISGAAEPQDSHFPEDWLLSTTAARNVGREHLPEEGISRVFADGETVPLTRLAADCPEELFGPEHLRRFGESAGFLLKYLDSSIRLHMQCHPPVSFARRYLNSNSGKTEGYYILGVRPGCEGYIYLGFQRAPEPGAFKSAIEKQDVTAILACFDKLPVKPGDCFYVPGGIPHAIGEGIFMVEIMEPTDFAVRIEFERGGYRLPESARFMNRGIDFALSMFDFTARSAAQTKQEFFIEPEELPIRGDGRRFSLFDRRKTDCFRAERVLADGEVELSHHSFRVLVVLHGEGLLLCGDRTLPLKQYDRILIPYKSPALRLQGSLEVLIVLPPDPSTPLPVPAE